MHFATEGMPPAAIHIISTINCDVRVCVHGEDTHTFRAIRALGNTANMATAVSISAKTWRGEGRREDRHTAPNTAALRDMELDALHSREWEGGRLKPSGGNTYRKNNTEELNMHRKCDNGGMKLLSI